MFSSFFNTVFYEPLYNGLVFLAAIMPGNDLGLAIIALTLLVKVLLIPLSHKAMTTQNKLKKIEPEIARLKEKYKDNQEQAVQIMMLYKEHGINPFASLLVLFIQIPIVLALYFVFADKLDLSSPYIYSFTLLPETINPYLLGFVDMTARGNYPLAILTGIGQYFQMKLALPPMPKLEKGKEVSFKDELARSFSLQAQYVLPILLVFISLGFSAALPLYWFTSSLFAIGHELVIRRKAKNILKIKN